MDVGGGARRRDRGAGLRLAYLRGCNDGRPAGRSQAAQPRGAGPGCRSQVSIILAPHCFIIELEKKVLWIIILAI